MASRAIFTFYSGLPTWEQTRGRALHLTLTRQFLAPVQRLSMCCTTVPMGQYDTVTKCPKHLVNRLLHWEHNFSLGSSHICHSGWSVSLSDAAISDRDCTTKTDRDRERCYGLDKKRPVKRPPLQSAACQPGSRVLPVKERTYCVHCTGWSNWILHRKLKYFICCLRDLFLFLV